MSAGRTTAVGNTTLQGSGASSAVVSGAATLALTVLYHPDVERVGDRVQLGEVASGGVVLLSRTAPAFAPPGRPGGAPLDEEHLSRRPLRLSLLDGGGVRLELGDSGTAVVVRGKRLRGSAVFTVAQVKRGVVLELSRRVVLLLHHAGALHDVLAGPGEAGDRTRELAGESDGIQRVLWELRSVADLDLPVLLRGETGVGKELVAQAVHRASARRAGPFVAVNLGAIPPALASSEFFGADRGAFTGSVRRQAGYFEQARGGTLFLDEIGEAPAELQVALLRALETGEIQPVGAQQARKVDVRIIAATDADLEAKVASGSFRAPLLNRLAAYEILIPPLRDRRDDIGRLLIRFLREELERVGEAERLSLPGATDEPWLPAPLVARLADHDWPGNIRQLRNAVRQLVIGSRGRPRLVVGPAMERLLEGKDAASGPPGGEEAAGRETAADAAREGAAGRETAGIAAPPSMPAVEPAARAAAKEPPAAPASSRRKPAEVTEEEVAEALRASRWDLAATASLLRISRASLYLLLQRYPRFRTAGGLPAEEIIRCHGDCGGDLGRMVERLEVSERALRRRLRELRLE
ncbi:sigma 54-interacting transcriptional regulator [Sorangium sp. So ce1078]|uniref:sigma 54-interacting transcriptional regulator n=1 Tax=Sorangium sp. So ce1078 TaxID=3133329 RepID=UPI003F64513E